LGTETLDGNFIRDRGSGEVFAGHSNNVMFDATMEIAVQRSGFVKFVMNGDDGFRLSLDNDPDASPIIDDWKRGRWRSKDEDQFVMLEPGLHTLKLQYFENTGKSKLKFETDSDVLSWTEVECSGTRSLLPDSRYFVFNEEGATIDSASERFGVPVPDILELNEGVSDGSETVDRILLP
jgi:hypothetical protein